MYNRPTSKLTVSQRLSIMRKGKSIHSSSQQSLDIVPPERPLIQKFMFWKRPCLPRYKSSIDSSSDEVLEQTVCFEPAPQDPCSCLEKSGLTSSDESSVASQSQRHNAVAGEEPLVLSPPPPPPGEPGPHEDRDEAAASAATPPPRPPLARRSVTLQGTPMTTATTTTVPNNNKPSALLLARGVSYTTQGSRHSRHHAGELPRMQHIFTGTAAPSPATSSGGRVSPQQQMRIPLSISARPRLVSALADDDNDDDDIMADLNYSDDDEDDVKNDETHENKEPNGSSKSMPPTSDLWMQAWVNQSNSNSRETSFEIDDVNDENDDDDEDESAVLVFEELEAASDDTENKSSNKVTYLPVEPVPKVAVSKKDDDNSVVFTCGWMAVLRNQELVTNYNCDVDENDDASVLPHLDPSAIHYVQLLQTGHLHLISLVKQRQPAQTTTPATTTTIKIGRSTLRSAYVGKRAGHCLVVQSAEDGSSPPQTITLLPVNLPASYLRQQQQRAMPTKKQQHACFFTPFHELEESDNADNAAAGDLDRYAPQEQHEAILHVQFGMDAALRAACG